MSHTHSKTITNTLTILQHNVLHWPTNESSCRAAYHERDPDVILLNSTGVLDGDLITIPGYDVRQSNASGCSASGSAVAVRCSLNYRWKPVTSDGLMKVVVELEHERVVIATQYIPPRAHNVVLIRTIRQLANECLPTYLLADINAHHNILHHTSNDARGRIIKTAIQQRRVQYLGPYFDTFISGGRKGRPDAVLTNMHTHNNYHISPGPPTTSDHIPTIMKLSCRPIRVPISPRFDVGRTDWSTFRKKCDLYSAVDLEGATKQGVDDAVKDLMTFLSSLRKEVTPLRKTRTLPAPERTTEIRRLKRRQRVLLQRILGGFLDRRVHAEYNDLRRRLRPLYLHQKEKLWDDLCRRVSAETDSASFWKSIRRMMGCQRQPVAPTKDQQGNPLEGDEAICRAFSDKLGKQFCISDEENADFDTDFERGVVDEWIDARPNPAERVNVGSLPLDGLDEVITPGEMLHCLESFGEKAPGASGISKRYIVEAGPVVHLQLLCIFNAALSVGYFPHAWKEARVAMVPKRPNPSSVDDFRPISLLEVPGKLFEKIINRRLQERLESFEVYQSSQFGFRGQRGCREAVALGHEFIGQRLAEGLCVRVVLRDVKSAFDKVWHTGLCVKLLRLNLPPNILALLESFLTGRTARVVSGVAVGMPIPILAGVPQGAILSPTLYNVYISDVPAPRRHRSKNIVFADDISQIVAAHPKMIKCHVEHEVKRINTFEKRWKIRTNHSKFTIVALDRKVKHLTYYNGLKNIECVPTGRFLGFQLNRQGAFSVARQVAARGEKTLAELSKLAGLSTSRKRLLGLALVRSRLTYPVTPWAALPPQQLYTLQKVWNKTINFIGGYARQDRTPQRDKHQLLRVEPLNTVLQRMNADTWASLEALLPQEIAALRTNARRLAGEYRANWQSSLLATESLWPGFCTLQEARTLVSRSLD